MSAWMSSTGIERRYEIDAKQDESNCKKEKSKFQENDETTEERKRKPRVGGGGWPHPLSTSDQELTSSWWWFWRHRAVGARQRRRTDPAAAPSAAGSRHFGAVNATGRITHLPRRHRPIYDFSIYSTLGFFSSSKISQGWIMTGVLATCTYCRHIFKSHWHAFNDIGLGNMSIILYEMKWATNLLFKMGPGQHI
jgi:hypothetical protein